jgi:hypothetical protein
MGTYTLKKLNGRSLKAFEVWDKLNLDKISKSYLGYHDLKRLHTFIDYLESLQFFFCYDKIYWPSNILNFFNIYWKIMGSYH